ncbi:MAG: hypothetical protein IT530_18490 [Burkholderiales bacterium]|nr:hypothetical protein [Burkholderiales bacterium]
MPAAPALIDPCGRFLPALLVHDLRDRLHGRSRRANARWGRLQRPDAQRRPLWIVSGASRASVRLGVELTRALATRRTDASALFTYEAEHQDLLGPLARSPRTRWSYGPSDYIRAVQAAWHRLAPLGIVIAGVTPRPNLLALCEGVRHALLVAPPQPVSGRFERIYPSHVATCSGGPCAPQADLSVLLDTPAEHADSTRALIGAAARRLWWWHGADPTAAKRLYALFRGHLPDDVLIVSGEACASLAAESATVMRLSVWERVPAPPGTLVLADEPGWLAALAPSLSGIHLAVEQADFLWQALAGGAIVSAPEFAPAPSPEVAASLLHACDENDVIAAWTRMGTDAAARDRVQQAQRAVYAAENRVALANATELIERVCRWR